MCVIQGIIPLLGGLTRARLVYCALLERFQPLRASAALPHVKTARQVPILGWEPPSVHFARLVLWPSTTNETL